MIEEEIKIFDGDRFIDDRGIISFVNGFKMNNIKRFYVIKHSDVKTIRAWQGHKMESKYFCCIKGAFRVAVIKTDNWKNPDKDTRINFYDILSSSPQILCVYKNSINGFRALENNSILLVFSDKSLKESQKDDHRWEIEYFNNWRTVFFAE